MDAMHRMGCGCGWIRVCAWCSANGGGVGEGKKKFVYLKGVSFFALLLKISFVIGEFFFV